MTVTKHKDIDWRFYLRQLAESPSSPSDIELVEFAGYLLRRDMEDGNRVNMFRAIFEYDNLYLADVVASFLTAKSPEATEDLIKTLQVFVVDYYDDEMKRLIKEEEWEIEAQQRIARSKEEPEGDSE